MMFYYKLPFPWLNLCFELNRLCQQIRQKSVFKDPFVLSSINLTYAQLHSGQGLVKAPYTLAVTGFLSHRIHSHMKIYTYCATLNACNQCLITSTGAT